MSSMQQAPSGICSVCGIRKRLTDSGNVKLHHRHGVICDGTAKPPKAPRAERARGTSWSAARRATLARDSGRCRKCQRRSDLDVHHIKERVYGGTDDLANLITLCSDCHAEWTFCEPPGMPFDTWLAQPPARMLVHVFALEWPDNVSAREFKALAIEQMRAARADYEAMDK